MDERPKIYVMPKVQFHDTLTKNNIDDENVDEFIKIAFISINDSDGEYYHQPLFHRNHHNVLNLWFDDVEHDLEISPTNKGVNSAFSKEQATKVIEFLESNKNAKTVLIHCAAGISRSGAVGRVALEYLQGDREQFRINNNQISPNPRVERMLNEAWRESKQNRR